MKTISRTLIFLITALLIFGAASSALAGRDGKQRPGGEDPWDVDPQAKGTRLSGVLAIHYELMNPSNPSGENNECGDDDFFVKMTFFMRLSSHKELYAFGSLATDLCYYGFAAQQAAIEAYIKSDVIPGLFQAGVISIKDACFAIKQTEYGVDDPSNNPFTDPADPQYSIVDLVLAIDEKTSCP